MNNAGIPATERPASTRIAVASLLGPGLVTTLTLVDVRVPTMVAALLYVLVVVVAAAVGGAVAGVGASFVSFLALNFFFTPPLHTFAVGKLQDLLALLVFLLVSSITGLLLSNALRQKSRAETREQQTRLMNRFTSALLSGRPLQDEVAELAGKLLELLRLAWCEIKTEATHPVRATWEGEAGEAFAVDLIVAGTPVGSVAAAARGPHSKLGAQEQAVVRNVAAQLSLALETARLTSEIGKVQLDAERNRLRAALFSGVTHDLKTPLAAITASVTSLQEEGLFSDADRRDHLDTIRQEAEHLDRVVSNLMDLARLRAGALTPSRVPAAIDELIEAVVSRLQPLLAGRTVHLNLHDELPEMALDVIQIDQVLTNLIENAVKFSPRQTPIQITAVGNPAHVRVTVADHGPGIPRHDRDRIFGPFERGADEIAGTGLGLAIAKAAVEAHGGRIWAQDSPGGGAAITFELPTVSNDQPIDG